MTFRDILLQIDTYPEPTPVEGVDWAVALAKLMGARITAVATAVDLPLQSNRLADFLIGLSNLEKQVEDESRAAGRRALDHFTTVAKDAAVYADAELARLSLYLIPAIIAKRARTHDVCLVPLAGGLDGQVEIAMAAMFESGRPVLVFRPSSPPISPRLNRIVVAWDGSRCAARALADAMPLLSLAAEVQVLSILREKPGLAPGATADVTRHLRSHGIEAKGVEIDGGGKLIESSLGAYVRETKPDLMVMGAYGHSRLREFVLGGATEYILEELPVPVLLAH